MASQDKVQYGLRNVHIFPKESDVGGQPQYGAPLKIPGAVTMVLEPRGEMIEFNADDMLYYAATNNDGYNGTFTFALMPDEVAAVVLGEVKEGDFVHELANNEGQEFAIAYEVQGDKNVTKHIVYNVKASRPTQTNNTKGTEVNTTELSFVASPVDVAGKRHVKSKSHSGTKQATLDAWYTSVQGLVPAPAGV